MHYRSREHANVPPCTTVKMGHCKVNIDSAANMLCGQADHQLQKLVEELFGTRPAAIGNTLLALSITVPTRMEIVAIQLILYAAH